MAAICGAVLGLLGGSALAADWSHAQQITVTASEYDFSPDGLTLRRGVAYRLHFENRGKELHEFTAPEFFQHVELGNPEILNVDRTELVVEPGQAKDLYFVPQDSGEYRLFCADHDWAGMTGQITVE